MSASANERHVFGQALVRHSSEPSQQSHTPSFTREANTSSGVCGRFLHVYLVSGHAPVDHSSVPSAQSQ
eukprot:2981777-Prymnesium_polylepis.1